MEFPGFVYRSPGSRISAGRCFDLCSVGDEAALAEKLAAGWSETVEAAYKQAGGGFVKLKRQATKLKRKPSRPLDGVNHILEEAASPIEDDSPVTRKEMDAKASELGIKFDPRITDKMLLRRIQKAIKV